MKTFIFQERDEWFHSRLGKITGSRLKDVIEKRGGGKKQGFYELIAEKLGVPPDGENAMERGHRLEMEALERFEKETGKTLDKSLTLWTRDEDENIAISPDAVVTKEEAACEVKCLSSARHIEAYYKAFILKKSPWESIPSEGSYNYYYQALQYFVVNDTLEKLYFIFYDPRFAMFTPSGDLRLEGDEPPKTKLDFFVIELTRSEIMEEAQEVLDFERRTLGEVNAIVNELTF